MRQSCLILLLSPYLHNSRKHAVWKEARREGRDKTERARKCLVLFSSELVRMNELTA